VVAPFLGSVFDRGAKATSSAAPRRLIVMFTHYGCVTTRFFPTLSHGALTAADLEPTTLRHLSPFVGKMLMPRGIRAMNEWTSGLVRGQGNDPHTQVVGSYFTCHPVTPNSNDPFSFNQDTKFLAMPLARSLDHVMAEQVSPGGVPLYLRVINKAENAQSRISYSAPETPYLGVGTPLEVFSGLTGLFRNGEPMNPDTYQAVKGKSVIDLVRDDLDTLGRFDMSQSDKNKLEAWKALLDDTGGVMRNAACNEETASLLGATDANVSAAPELADDQDALTVGITSNMDAADVYSSVAALAAVCNANPVIILKYPGAHTYRGLGLPASDAHTLSHRILNATGQCVSGVIDMLEAMDDYHARKFARLVGMLDSVPEGDGTVLDNCAAIWFQEMSDGNAHNLNNLPIVQAGGMGGYFRTGVAVNVDDGSPALSQGNSEAFCSTTSSSSGSVQSTSTDPALANAPINKYFCNLMNALGVKAGVDGFPALGGVAEVTHFGMYDRTEDFVGGGTNPPAIHDPGEFTDLKA
jgi:hypothetical protein